METQKKFIYFPLHVRGSACRMLLSHAKVQFEDEVLSFPEFAQKKKAGEFPNGQVPVWVQNGQQFTESCAILRLIGAQHGYYPEDIFERHATDAMVDYANDFITLYKPHLPNGTHTDETKKEFADRMTKFCEHLNKRLEKSGKNYICGDKMTIGDFQIAAVIFNLPLNEELRGGADYTNKGKEIIAANPIFSAYVERLKTELKTYLETRGKYIC